MGDRANVLVKDGQTDSGVYLYTHWEGTELPKILRDALAKKWRWQDVAYLTRIIFCEMVKGSEGEETGYGISSFVTDGEGRTLTVDTATQTVGVGAKRRSFADFAAMTDAQCESVWEF